MDHCSEQGRFDTQSVWLVLLLSVLTLGVYVPIWFLRKSRLLNGVVRYHQIRSSPAIFLLILSVARVIAEISIRIVLGGRLQGVGVNALELISACLTVLIVVLVVVLGLEVRRILLIHLGRTAVRPAHISLLFTVLIGIFYLQYKMNRMPTSGTICNCGYDLTGNTSGLCPECGGAIPKAVLDRLAGHASSPEAKA